MNIIDSTAAPSKVSLKRRKRGRNVKQRRLDDLLTLFPKVKGHQRRKLAFVELCWEYYQAYLQDENLRKLEQPNPGSHRSELHTKIMRIVQQLFLQPNAEQLYGGFQPSRKQVREIVVRTFGNNLKGLWKFAGK